MEAIKTIVNYNHLIRGSESCTYQDMSDIPLVHYHADTMEEVFQKSRVGKIRKGKYKLKSNVVGIEILNSQFKNINSQFTREYDEKVKYAIWEANKIAKQNQYLNFFMKFEIIVLTADDSNETMVALVEKIETDPLMWGLGFLGILLVPFVAIWELIKLFFKVLFFIEDNKMWGFVMWMSIIAVSSYYSSNIADGLLLFSQELAKLKQLGVI